MPKRTAKKTPGPEPGTITSANLTVRLPMVTYNRAVGYALANGLSRATFVAMAIEYYLDRKEGK